MMWGVDLPTLGLPHMSCQSRNQTWALRVEICKIAIQRGDLIIHLVCQILPNMSSQSRKEIWPRGGICEIAIWLWGVEVDLPTPDLQNMSSQSRSEIWLEQESVESPFDGGGKICQHLVCQIWVLREGICNCHLMLGVDVPTLGLWHMSLQSRKQISALRVGIREISVQRGRVDLPPAVPNMSFQMRNEIWPSVGIHEIAIWWEVDLPTPGLPHMNCQSRNL